MPTGYTASIKDGITFNKFAMDCARAFGACVMLRDEPAGIAIPEFQPSDYHAKALATAQAALAETRSLTPAQAETAALNIYLNAREARAKSIRENDALRAKYEQMLVEVNAWHPPTPDHAGLRDFMREQIEESIRFDCCHEREPVAQLTGPAWQAQEIARHELNVTYHAIEDAAEVARTASRNEWVKALRASLEG